MFKRICSFILTLVILVSCNLNVFSAYGKEQDAVLIQIPILSNEIDEKYLTGYLFNNSECFVSIDDICKLTRSTYEISGDNIIIRQGIISISLNIKNNTIKLEEQNTECEIKNYNGTYLLKPYGILKLLCADCKYISENNIFTILMPPVTTYEAIDFEYNNFYYYIGNEKLSIIFILMGSNMFMDLLSRGTNAISFLYNNPNEQYVDNSLYELSKVNIYDYPSVKKSSDDVLNERMYIAEEALKITNNLNSVFEDIIKCDNALSKLSGSIETINNIAEVVSLIKSAEEKINYDLDSYLLLKRTFTHENLDELINMDLYITDRAEYVSKVMESRVSAYLNTGEEKIQEFLFNKGLDTIVKNSDKINKTNASNFLIAYDIGVSVTKLFMNDTFEAHKCNLNAIYLSEMQHNTLVIAQKLYEINRQEHFTNATNIKRLIDMLSLYDRVTIAMYKNLKKADDELKIYDKEFSNSFEDFCNKSADNAYKLSLCKPEDTICSLKQFSDYYENDIFDNKYNEPIEPTTNYEWHLAPTIEAEDINVVDECQWGVNYGHFIESEYNVIKINGKYGVIDTNGNIVVNPEYDSIYGDLYNHIRLKNNRNDILFCCKKNTTTNDNYYCDICDTALSTTVYGSDYFYDLSLNRLALLATVPHINNSMNELIFGGQNSPGLTYSYKPVVARNSVFHDVKDEKNIIYTYATLGNKFGIVKNNKILLDFEYNNATSYKESITALCKDDKWGYVNDNGDIIIPFEYDGDFIYNSEKLAYLPSDNYIALNKNGGGGYYDIKGNEVIPCGTFEEVRPVHNGLAWVKKNGKWGVIKLKDIEIEPNIKLTDLTVNVDNTYIGEITKDNCTHYYTMNINEDSSLFTVQCTNSNGVKGGFDLPIDKFENGIYFYTNGSCYDRNQITGGRINVFNNLTGTITVNDDGSLLWKTKDSLPYELILNPNNVYSKEPLFTGIVNTEKDPLNVRKSPSTEAEIIGRLDKGSTITVYSEADGWYEIEYNGGIGYVSKDYIKVNLNASNSIISTKDTINNLTCSSQLQNVTIANTTYNYNPWNVVDDDVSTCWSEGIYGKGENEYLYLELNKLYTINGIKIYNGLQTNSDLFYKNSRVKKCSLEFSNNQKLEYELNGEWENCINNLVFKTPINTSFIKITILSTYDGNKYDDTCISEIEII